MLKVIVRENEPLEAAPRRFKCLIERNGPSHSLSAKKFYEKPTTERKCMKAAAAKRHNKEKSALALPKRLF